MQLRETLRLLGVGGVRHFGLLRPLRMRVEPWRGEDYHRMQLNG